MTPTQPLSMGNRLLKALSSEDRALLEPDLVPCAVEKGQPLIRPNEPIGQLYFPVSGLGSVTTDLAEGRIEVGIVGNEGLIGAAPILLCDTLSPHAHFVQIPGLLLRIGREPILAAVERSPTLRRLFLRYVHSLLIQTTYTAFVNAHYTIEVRLARWLLMCQDRVEGDHLNLTHEFLSMMLGVQRSGVTVALQVLEGNQLIRARRGHIQVLDRARLMEMAGNGYGVPEAAYARLIEGG